jgi:hypothetical protein
MEMQKHSSQREMVSSPPSAAEVLLFFLAKPSVHAGQWSFRKPLVPELCSPTGTFRVAYLPPKKHMPPYCHSFHLVYIYERSTCHMPDTVTAET